MGCTGRSGIEGWEMNLGRGCMKRVDRRELRRGIGGVTGRWQNERVRAERKLGEVE